MSKHEPLAGSERDESDELASIVERICAAKSRQVFPGNLRPGDVICSERIRQPAPREGFGREPQVGVVTDVKEELDVVFVAVADTAQGAVPEVLVFDQDRRAMCDGPETVAVVGEADLRAMGPVWVESTVELEETDSS